MDEIKTQKHDAIILSTSSEKEMQNEYCALLKKSPLPDDELLANIGLYVTSKSLSRILFFYEIYQKILHTHGVIMEFGVRWGQSLLLLSALRGIFEPYNRHRKVIGFDTFEGFQGMSEKDGENCKCIDGSFSVPHDYEEYLGRLIGLQDGLNPIPHLRKYELVKGDATATIPAYLSRHPETVVSMAIFDFDIYKPTRIALEAIKPRLFKGSVLVFDELCDDIFPGETTALMESMPLSGLRIQRYPMTARISYAVVE
ncbi:MAG: crotonobetainyl-CoA--carnitine CoA-transferase [Spirochaetia bacterium]